MVRKKGSLILCGAFLFVAWNALLLLYLWGRPPTGRLEDGGGAEPVGKEEWGLSRRKEGQTNLAGEVIRLADEVELQFETQKKLLKQIESHRVKWAQQKDVGKRETDDPIEWKEFVRQPSRPPPPPPPLLPTDSLKDRQETELKHSQRTMTTVPAGPKLEPHPATEETKKEEFEEKKHLPTASALEPVIPILVIACDRVTVKRSLDKLTQYRPTAELHPIIVSQDCGHAETARVISSYGDQVTHIRQPDLSDIRVKPDHRKFQGYYKIARHYRWALNQVFNTFGYSTVVVVEDDLEVRPLTFFSLFATVCWQTLTLLLSLRCRWRRTFSNISELCIRSCALTPPCGVCLRGTTTAEMLWWTRPGPSCSTGQTSSLAWGGCSSRRCGMSWNTNGPRPSGTTGCGSRNSDRDARASARKFHGPSLLAERESV